LIKPGRGRGSADIHKFKSSNGAVFGPFLPQTPRQMAFCIFGISKHAERQPMRPRQRAAAPG
jgi:hypothetical protein